MSSMDVDAAAAGTIAVVVRHQGKKYDIDVDVSEPGSIFKFQVYSVTGVQPENQKILIKGKQVKDDTDMSSLGLKPAQAIMVLGQPGAAPTRLQAPTAKPTFLEDMSGADAAGGNLQIAPGGLVNLGNTCYLNASLQAMRSLPELQDSLVNRYQEDTAETSQMLALNMKKVFTQMASSYATYSPDSFLATVRMLNPRFAERSRTGAGYAQQDAEEAWTFVMDNLRRNLLLRDAPAEIEGASGSSSSNLPVSIVKRYLAGEMQKTLICDEVAGRTDAQTVPTTESFLSLPCHINININHLRDGLLAGLTEKIDKTSEELGREASFTSTLKISRLPKYLTVNFVRFYWKRDIQKKAKIMRKVTFPHELDISEMCTDELRAKLVPVREKVREVRKEIEEIERSNKKRKRRLSEERKAEASGSSAAASSSTAEADKKDSKDKKEDKKEGAEGEEIEYKTDAQIEAEKRESLEKAKEELYQLAKPRIEEDPYANHTGLYELRAVVSHQGASANSGHYTAFVKKGTIVNPKTGKMSEEDGNWWWFNDDTVTEVGSERIDALAGGGESHSALILVYGSAPLPLPESRKTQKFFQS